MAKNSIFALMDSTMGVRLNLIPTGMIPQVHDGMTQVDAIALVVSIFEQGVELPAEACCCHLDMNSRHTCDVEVFCERLGLHRPR